MKPLAETRSVCPECLASIPAHIVTSGQDVYLRKRCPEHGEWLTVIWRGAPSLEQWKRPKAPAPVTMPRQGQELGCPHDCGICPSHGQRACTVLLEVTQRCDLGCPVCFASSGAGDAAADPSLEELAGLLAGARERSGPVVLQLSGGEPTMRQDLPEIIALARKVGFAHVQLNTNGLRLNRPGYSESLAKAGLGWVFLQFDGVSDEVYQTLRGRPLLEAKLAAVRAASDAGLGVVLVATVVPGVNDGQLGALVQLAASLLPRVRGVHLQPVSYFGRYPEGVDDSARITLPELIAGLEAQSSGLLRAVDFQPPGCEHERCSFHGNFRVEADGRFTALSPAACCCSAGGESAAQDAANLVARQWSAVPLASAQAPGGGLGSMDEFLARTRGRTMTVTAMAFQDAWTLDLERLSGCCVHVAAPDGRMVPFCAWNLTARDGRPLHRAQRLTQFLPQARLGGEVG